MKTLRELPSAQILVISIMIVMSYACTSENDAGTNKKAVSTDMKNDVTKQTVRKTSMKDVKQELKETVQTIKDYGFDQRDEAVSHAKSAIDQLDRKIEALETKRDKNWDRLNQSARQKTRQALNAVRKQRTELAEWYGSMKSGSANAWEDIKKGFSGAYISLHNAWDKAEKDLDTDSEPGTQNNES